MALITDSIQLAGDWGHMVPDAVKAVLDRMRHACLDDVRLVSDHQPSAMRVDEHTAGPPAIWLHFDNSTIAYIIVDIGERDWSQLAYQFGHELGHVVANSWQQDGKPLPPCQWLEEAMVEAFSLRGLARLADGWQKSPPFANDNGFGNAIADYRRRTLETYVKLATEQGSLGDFARWFAGNQSQIESIASLSEYAKAASVTILTEYERNPGCIEALGALNRWPERAGVPIGDYLSLWEKSCAELEASSYLPGRIRQLLSLQ